MKRAFIATALVVPMVATAQVWTIYGRALDPAGVPVSDVQIEVDGTFRRTVSAGDGTFVITDLRAGSVQLLARRLGYLPVDTVARWDNGVGAAELTIVMQPVALQLSGVVVPSDAPTTESQTVTRESVRNLPALGEADILRVLPFLGAVSQPYDMMSVVHLAGSASDETSFSLDGHPVQSPLHFNGMFSGINVAAIDRVDVFAAHSPLMWPSRIGGLIDISSKKADRASHEVVVSLLSSGVTVVRPRLIGDVSLLASGRITYMDQVLRALHVGAIRGDAVPLSAYADGLMRIDIPVTDRWQVNPLFLFTQDRHKTGGPEKPPVVVGEVLSGVRVGHTGAIWSVEARASTDVFSIGSTEQRRGRDAIDVRQRWSSLSVGAIGDGHSYRLAAKVSCCPAAQRRSHF